MSEEKNKNKGGYLLSASLVEFFKFRDIGIANSPNKFIIIILHLLFTWKSTERRNWNVRTLDDNREGWLTYFLGVVVLLNLEIVESYPRVFRMCIRNSSGGIVITLPHFWTIFWTRSSTFKGSWNIGWSGIIIFLHSSRSKHNCSGVGGPRNVANKAEVSIECSCVFVLLPPELVESEWVVLLDVVFLENTE